MYYVIFHLRGPLSARRSGDSQMYYGIFHLRSPLSARQSGDPQIIMGQIHPYSGGLVKGLHISSVHWTLDHEAQM